MLMTKHTSESTVECDRMSSGEGVIADSIVTTYNSDPKDVSIHKTVRNNVLKCYQTRLT